MKLSKAQVFDISKVVKIHNEIMDYKYSYDSFYNELNFDYSLFYVLKDDEDVIGYFIIHCLFETIDLVIIGVNETYQNKGYGHFLMDYIIYLTLKNKGTNIMLEVNINNKKAISFYENYDFKLIDRRINYYGNNNDALVYRKEL
ncbi:MAG: GNAT family N-acetyltransferase [Bacilli bacterium]|jgi:ribosomal-protein-alanine N-acetyltransferase|nr:GNAT family N-acetyltransferase [Bacilli bacterium]